MSDTLGSQVYASGLDPYGLGVILQRAYMILSLFYVPIAILWWFSEPVFLALGQEDYIAEWSCKFLRTLIPGGLGYILFETTKKYLQAQGRTSQRLKSNIRHHACFKLCPTYYFASQRGSQLSVCIHLQIRASRRTSCNGNNLLALFCPPSMLRQICRWFEALGRLVQTCFPRLVDLHSVGSDGVSNGWHGMASI